MAVTSVPVVIMSVSNNKRTKELAETFPCNTFAEKHKDEMCFL
jgi:hypothetical protein